MNTIRQRYLIGGESFNNGFYGNVMLYIPVFKNNQINLFVSNNENRNSFQVNIKAKTDVAANPAYT